MYILVFYLHGPYKKTTNVHATLSATDFMLPILEEGKPLKMLNKMNLAKDIAAVKLSKNLIVLSNQCHIEVGGSWLK